MKLLVPALVAVSMAAAPAMAGDWSGAYLGLGVGYGDADGPGARWRSRQLRRPYRV